MRHDIEFASVVNARSSDQNLGVISPTDLSGGIARGATAHPWTANNAGAAAAPLQIRGIAA